MSVGNNSSVAMNRPVVEVSQPLLRAAEAVSPATKSEQIATVASTDNSTNETGQDFIRVSSSIGRAASAGQLSRQEAIEIYRQIASFL